MRESPARIIVLGAGAIGAPIGALLHERGVPVVLVARGAHGSALERGGLDLRSPDGARVLRTPVVRDIVEARPTADDLVIVSVMGHHTADAVAELPASVPVLSLQNGLHPLDLLAAKRHPLLAGVVYVPAQRLAPGVVALFGVPHPGTILLGAWPPAACPTDWVPWLCDRLTEIGFGAEHEADLGPWVRAKLLGNLAGIVVALCDDPPDEVVRTAQSEARAVWDAAGLSYFSPEALVAKTGGLSVGRIDGQKRVGGSTRHALGRGARLETACLHEPIIELGMKHGISTQVNRALVRLAEEAVAGGWTPGTMPAEELRRAVAG